MGGRIVSQFIPFVLFKCFTVHKIKHAINPKMYFKQHMAALLLKNKAEFLKEVPLRFVITSGGSDLEISISETKEFVKPY